MASLKETLRREIKDRLKEIPQEEFHSQGAKAAALLHASPVWERFNTVFLFLSMKHEIDTKTLIETALKDSKKVFAPRVEGKGLVFYTIDNMKQAESEDFPALILAPGLAFDNEGNRLGRGGGYYDRYFAELNSGGFQYTAIGLCMDIQIVANVPMGRNDKKVNAVLTGKALICR